MRWRSAGFGAGWETRSNSPTTCASTASTSACGRRGTMRLALMKATAVLALALLLGCELPGKRVTDPSQPHVVQIVASPAVVALDPYQSQQFLAFGRTQAGDS